ncbi:hypothetical protein DEAC_c23970 [Desulfosporosinus acididurans]|uniref:Cyclic lactone autoinducer peptide n=1 Tax=Desulfosporosinus acididurans TaxID=476652 RepID=A0A0J1FR42_9FIRM|nr:hypothetical protein DEAC_c23970 [Desulfosporosinus acididurans]
MKIQLKIAVIVVLVVSTLFVTIWIYIQPPKIDKNSANKINDYMHEHNMPAPTKE